MSASRPSERRGRGLSLEDRAAAFLEEQGFTIVARNHTCPAGEVDIVARDGDDLVFVEVRSRRTEAFGTPAESIGPGKRRRIVAAATDFTVRAGVWATASIRFDVIAIVERSDGLQIDHLRAAFDADGEP